jgi:hypothetical protein
MTAAANNTNQIICPNCNMPFTIDESGYADILKQVRDKEFEVKLKEQLELQEKTKAAELELAQQKLINENNEAIAKAQLKIQELQLKVESSDSEKQSAINEALREIELERNELASQLQIQAAEQAFKEATIKEQNAAIIKSKDEQIAQYKDFKARLSTKLVGESLELHCEAEFNKLRAGAFSQSYFEKDNDAKLGGKGDYIFKESADGIEFISIMFEMKNESEETREENRGKNEDFFKKLDKDRTDKGCEYAVLVSLLELDNEFYNNGIADVSHRYPKMYVVRPQFFIPIITLLRNAALNTLSHKQELAVVKAQTVDVSKFESKLADVTNKFNKNVKYASDNFEEAIKAIDKAIKELQDSKEHLERSAKFLGQGASNLGDISVRKLTHGNNTMKKLFDDARRTIDGEVEEESPLEIES